jgi:hypothetical protein
MGVREALCPLQRRFALLLARLRDGMSEIDWSLLRSLTARELISALIRDGLSLLRG